MLSIFTEENCHLQCLVAFSTSTQYYFEHTGCRRSLAHHIIGEAHFGAGQLGAVPFRRRIFGRRFLIYFYFSSYEEKTMKQAIP